MGNTRRRVLKVFQSHSPASVAIHTGDSKSNWEFVRINIPLVLGIGLSAQPVSGCDIGGFCADIDVSCFSNNTNILSILP